MVAKKSKTKYAVPDLGRPVSRRPVRVADAIRNEIAVLLLQQLRDPRLTLVCITSVDISPDLRNAKVYFSCPDENAKDAAAGLESAKGFIRTHLAKVLAMKYTPHLHFVHDLASRHHEEIARLFTEIENERKE